jgi:hypothetical protein
MIKLVVRHADPPLGIRSVWARRIYPPEAILAQSACPHFAINAADQISQAPDPAIDVTANDIRRIRQFLSSLERQSADGPSIAAFGRSPAAFELARIQTRLECVIEERDRLQLRLDSLISESISKITELVALPTQEIHIHPTGLTAIEGPTMSRDTYNIPGQAGAVGPGARTHDNTFQQIQSGIDLPKLAEELGRVRDTMKGEATGKREQDTEISAVAYAEEAAAKGDGPTALRYLKGAETWALGIAEKIGVAVATEALKRAI